VKIPCLNVNKDGDKKLLPNIKKVKLITEVKNEELVNERGIFDISING